MYIIMLGAPGAGKGTQADILSQEIDLPHIASGDLFRRALEERPRLVSWLKAIWIKEN